MDGQLHTFWIKFRGWDAFHRRTTLTSVKALTAADALVQFDARTHDWTDIRILDVWPSQDADRTSRALEEVGYEDHSCPSDGCATSPQLGQITSSTSCSLTTVPVHPQDGHR